MAGIWDHHPGTLNDLAQLRDKSQTSILIRVSPSADMRLVATVSQDDGLTLIVSCTDNIRRSIHSCHPLALPQCPFKRLSRPVTIVVYNPGQQVGQSDEMWPSHCHSAYKRCLRRTLTLSVSTSTGDLLKNIDRHILWTCFHLYEVSEACDHGIRPY